MHTVTRYAESELPTRHGSFRVLVYRCYTEYAESADQASQAELPPGGYKEHVALVRGIVRNCDDVLVRVHSECFTGETLGSLRCDCREQLDLALSRIAEVPCGVVVYLRQEGRGIGLGNKVRAYALQDRGIDTVDANLALGFEADARSYEPAAAILRDLGVGSVRMMTNNPTKLEGLTAAGIEVVAQVSHWAAASEHSAHYLKVKKSKMGHIDGETVGANAHIGKETSSASAESDDAASAGSPSAPSSTGTSNRNVAEDAKDASGR